MVPHHAAPLGFIRALPSHQTLSGRMPIRGNSLFPPDHAASLASWVSLLINYFQEDVHLREMLPSTISSSSYLSRLLCDPSLIYRLYVCTYS